MEYAVQQDLVTSDVRWKFVQENRYIEPLNDQPLTPTLCLTSSYHLPYHPSRPLTFPLDFIQLRRSRHLRPRPLAPDRQAHCMPPPPVGSHISQPGNIVSQLPAQVVLDVQRCEFSVQVESLFVRQRADFRGREDVITSHQASREVGADAVEGLEALLGIRLVYDCRIWRVQRVESEKSTLTGRASAKGFARMNICWMSINLLTTPC